MNNIRLLLVIGLTVLLGLLLVVLGTNWLEQHGRPNTSPVVVAGQDIAASQALTPSMLKVAAWPAGLVPAGSSSQLSALTGRVLKQSLVAGEPVLTAKLAPLGTQAGLAAIIAPGSRAITVRVNDVIGVAGFALPGNYVDILVNTDQSANGNGQQKSVSKIVLQHILVLAVAQQASRDDSTPRVVDAVTLQVRPEQAEKIDLARNIGTLSLILRNQTDGHDGKTPGVTRNMLLGQSSPLARRPGPAVARNCVQSVVGATLSRQCF